MRVPAPAVSHVQTLTETFLPHLRPAQQRGVAEWVTGVLEAQSGCEAAVLSALAPLGLPEHATRARLREVLCAGEDRAAPWLVSRQVCKSVVLAVGWGRGPSQRRSVGRQRQGWRVLPAQQRHRLGAEIAPADLPLVVLLGQQRPDQPDGRRRLGKMPTTFVRRLTSLLSRSSGLVLQIWRQCSRGKAR